MFKDDVSPRMQKNDVRIHHKRPNSAKFEKMNMNKNHETPITKPMKNKVEVAIFTFKISKHSHIQEIYLKFCIYIHLRVVIYSCVHSIFLIQKL